MSSLTPKISIAPHPDDPSQQVITFEPPVATWSFGADKKLDDLWLDLRRATAALLIEHREEPFDAAMQQKLQERILAVLKYWTGQYWLTIP